MVQCHDTCTPSTCTTAGDYGVNPTPRWRHWLRPVAAGAGTGCARADTCAEHAVGISMVAGCAAIDAARERPATTWFVDVIERGHDSHIAAGCVVGGICVDSVGCGDAAGANRAGVVVMLRLLAAHGVVLRVRVWTCNITPPWQVDTFKYPGFLLLQA